MQLLPERIFYRWHFRSIGKKEWFKNILVQIKSMFSVVTSLVLQVLLTTESLNIAHTPVVLTYKTCSWKFSKHMENLFTCYNSSVCSLFCVVLVACFIFTLHKCSLNFCILGFTWVLFPFLFFMCIKMMGVLNEQPFSNEPSLCIHRLTRKIKIE